MLPEIERLADEYCPTIPVIRKNLKTLYYRCPGVDYTRVLDEEAEDKFGNIDIYRDFDMDSADIIAFGHSSRFRSKRIIRGSNGGCAVCSNHQKDYVIFCGKCWKKKTAKDAYQIVDECINKIQCDKRNQEKFMNRTLYIPKKIKCKVHINGDAYTSNGFGGMEADEDENHYELREFTLVAFKK